MSTLGGIIFAIIIVYLVRHFSSYERADGDESIDASADPVLTQAERQVLTRAQRLRRRLLLTTASRKLFAYEFHCVHDIDKSELTVNFPMARRPLNLRIVYESTETLAIEDVRFEPDRAECSGGYQIAYRRKGDRKGIDVRLFSKRPVRKIVLELVTTESEFEYTAQITCARDGEEDFKLLREAYADLGAGLVESARKRFHSYEEYSDKNPYVCHQLAEIYYQNNDIPQAEEYAIRTAASGLFKLGVDTFRGIQDRKEHGLTVADVRSLANRAQGWELSGHHGIVVLQKQQRYLLELNGFHWRRFSEIMLVRRQAAARLLRRLGFHYSVSKELPLFTTLRIFHRNDDIEVVPLERFTSSDSEKKNVFITTEEEREGFWIVPDLETGDIIEWSYDALCHEAEHEGRRYPFILASIADAQHPTYCGQLQFAADLDANVAFATVNGDPQADCRDDKPRRRRIHTFRQDRCIPAKNTGFPNENNYLNPLVACARGGDSWADIAAYVRRVDFGEAEIDVRLPDVLAEVVSDCRDRELALQRAFYWVRDRIKYGAFHSAHRHIGQQERAAKIVESGIGDCKDKTYLLAAVCKKLDIPCQPVAVSTSQGLTIPELPANQFDHVFLRAKPDDRWLYLDAASPISVYRSAPFWCQGTQALVLDDRGTIIDIPEDDPELNLLSISEHVSSFQDGWLHSSVSFDSRGHHARMFDEHWKAVSLSLNQQQHAAQEALRHYLPGLIVTEHEKRADTADSDACSIDCRGPRCRTAALSDKVVAQIAWRAPALYLEYWRLLELDRLFCFQFPMTVDLQLRMSGEAYARLADISRITSFVNDICEIREDYLDESDAAVLKRRIVIKRNFVTGKLIEELPSSLESIEQALQIAIAFRK